MRDEGTAAGCSRRRATIGNVGTAPPTSALATADRVIPAAEGGSAELQLLASP
jgi:hypothetical protein